MFLFFCVWVILFGWWDIFYYGGGILNGNIIRGLFLSVNICYLLIFYLVIFIKILLGKVIYMINFLIIVEGNFIVV